MAVVSLVNMHNYTNGLRRALAKQASKETIRPSFKRSLMRTFPSRKCVGSSGQQHSLTNCCCYPMASHCSKVSSCRPSSFVTLHFSGSCRPQPAGTRRQQHVACSTANPGYYSSAEQQVCAMLNLELTPELMCLLVGVYAAPCAEAAKLVWYCRSAAVSCFWEQLQHMHTGAGTTSNSLRLYRVCRSQTSSAAC
jgi:hypothetical protein